MGGFVQQRVIGQKQIRKNDADAKHFEPISHDRGKPNKADSTGKYQEGEAQVQFVRHRHIRWMRKGRRGPWLACNCYWYCHAENLIWSRSNASFFQVWRFKLALKK